MLNEFSTEREQKNLVDVFDKEKRIEIMGRVRSRDTKPKLLVRRFLHSKGLRFRLYRKGLGGRLDLVFPSHRIVVFVHGCLASTSRLPQGKVARHSNGILAGEAFIQCPAKSESATRASSRRSAPFGCLGVRVDLIPIG